MPLRLLLRSSIRQIRGMRYRVAAIGLIAASGMAMLTGTFSAIDSLFATRDAHYAQGHMADLELRFIPEDAINVPALDDAAGVTGVERRLLLPGTLHLDGQRRLTTLLVGLELEHGPPHINRLQLLAGRSLDPSKPNEVLIERNLAQYHGFHVGDSLHLAIGKDDYRDLVVRGIVLSPEYLIATSDPGVFFPAKGSLGVIFAPIGLVEARLGFRLLNSLVFTFQPGVDRAALTETLKERADRKLSIEQIIPLHDQFGFLFLKFDLNAFAIYVPAIVIIFSLTAAIVTLFLLFQWIAGRRHEIGLLMALGYDKRRLFSAYTAPIAVLAVAAILVGTALSYVSLYAFGINYATAINFPDPALALRGPLIGLGAAGVVLSLGVAAIWPQALLLSTTPQDAVRAERNRGGRGHLGPLLRWFSHRIRGALWLRYALRGFLRGRATTAMTVISVALALGVSISYFISITSFETTMVRRFADDTWNLQVDFQVPLWPDELGFIQKRPEVTYTETYLRGSVRLVHGSQQQTALLTGIPADSMRVVEVKAGRWLQPGDVDTVVLESKRARELGYDIGDVMHVESGGHAYTARLVGTFSGALPGEAYTLRATAARWLDLEDQSTGMFIQSDNPERTRRELLQDEHVARATPKQEVLGQLLASMQEVMMILYTAEVFSIGVALLLVFSSTSFSIVARSTEYGMLRILGFGRAQIVGMIMAETLLVGLLGSLLAIPVGYVVAKYLLARASAAWFDVDLMAGWQDSAVILLPALLLIPLAVLPSVRTILGLPLIRILRERMFG